MIGRQEQQAAAFGHLHDAVHDLGGRLLGDRLAAVGAVGLADAGVEQAQIVVDFGDGAHGGARVAPRPLLVDGDGRAEALDLVDVGLFHQAQELARIGGERLDITALAFGVDRVERQAALAAAAEAGDHHQLVARDLQVDVLQVVFACAAHDRVCREPYVFSLPPSGFLRCEPVSSAESSRMRTQRTTLSHR